MSERSGHDPIPHPLPVGSRLIFSDDTWVNVPYSINDLWDIMNPTILV